MALAAALQAWVATRRDCPIPALAAALHGWVAACRGGASPRSHGSSTRSGGWAYTRSHEAPPPLQSLLRRRNKSVREETS